MASRKIQLTIATDYYSNWGLWESIREAIQNAADAQDQGHRMTVEHINGTLFVHSEGVKLDPSVWLLGESSKGDGRSRGRFGEGLKIGVLAAVRAGHKVRIINDDESWNPKLEPSEQFPGKNVLTISPHAWSKNASGRFTVEIYGVSTTTWREVFRPRFLFLDPPRDVIETSEGTILRDPQYKGRLYIKGIHVKDEPDLQYGYDFRDLETDHDRKMVDAYRAENAMSRMWEEALSRSFVTGEAALDLLEKNTEDIAHGSVFRYSGNGTDKLIADAFHARYGANAVPVRTMEQARELEHFQRVGIVVSNVLRDILMQHVDSLDKIKEEFGRAPARIYSWAELTDTEKTMWAGILPHIEAVAAEMGFPPVEARTTVVDFRVESRAGLLSPDGSIQIARKVLSSRTETVITLVHEIAHGAGADAAHSHEVACEQLFGRIINRLLG